MNRQIKNSLQKLFDKHRIVLWYDKDKEFFEQFENLCLDDVEKLIINNDEFILKYKILREFPENKFLIYSTSQKPQNKDNWLLDILLSHCEFKTEKSSIILAELGLSDRFEEDIRNHILFFKSGKRTQKLKNIVKSSDSNNEFKLKMLSICADSSNKIEEILDNLIIEYIQEKDTKINLINNCNLSEFLWEKLAIFNYDSENPSIENFIYKLFESAYKNTFKNDEASFSKNLLNNDARTYLDNFKNNRVHTDYFRIISKKCEEFLNIERDLENRNLHELKEIDYFELIDKKIQSDLKNLVLNSQITEDEVKKIIRLRTTKFFYEDFKNCYLAFEFSAEFFNRLLKLEIKIENNEDGIEKYIKNWFEIDKIYRKFNFYADNSNQKGFLKDMIRKIDNFYSNKFLVELNNLWQKQIDELKSWKSIAYNKNQNKFYENYINKDNKKMVVIISDALRYECGEELSRIILGEKGYISELDYNISMLPSYTQLGMSALLPNKEIEITSDSPPQVLIDSFKTSGLENRKKILEKFTENTSIAVKSDEILNMSADERKNFIKNHHIIYVYHNKIDRVGDKSESENNVFNAVEETLNDIKILVKNLFNANANNVIITADHGFLHQNLVDESDYISDFDYLNEDGIDIK
ncbi:MAG: BREX-1 system phosphatase PglZ type A, partial [Candidatus Muirbacterium halophilum]|nr:BREX-1 system phosphatase PglZ type A [Candidatus Muirbacterium halophilum]